MHLRTFEQSDLDAVVDLTIATFRPFYEQSFPAMVGYDADLFAHQHGQWEQDYRDEVPTLHDPTAGRHVAVAEAPTGEVVGCIAWRPEGRPQHGEIYLVAVAADHRGWGTGTALMEHAMRAMRADGMGFVGLGTGGDAFHAPARALYESLGFHPIPQVGYLRTL